METGQHHILYIEDHDDTRELVTLVLAERDYRVTTGSTLADGLKLAQEHHFDLYLLDSWLPDGSGFELCKKLREFDRSTPIMFFSAAAYECDKQAAIDSGAQCYLVKPAHLDELCTEVGALLEGSARQRRTTEASTLSNPRSAGSNHEPASSRAVTTTTCVR